MRRTLTRINVAFVLAILPSKMTRATAGMVNITVDDSAPDPLTRNNITYTPSNSWNEGQNCSVCSVRPSTSYTHGGTWHDTTYDTRNFFTLEELSPENATFSFTGSAIYVYGILDRADAEGSRTTASDLLFFIDGQQRGNLSYEPDGAGEFTYNALLFSNDNLSYQEHNLVIQNGQEGGQPSLLLLDYLIYTTWSNDSSNITTTATPTLPQQAPTPTPQTSLFPSSHASTATIRTSGTTIGLSVALGIVSGTFIAVVGVWLGIRRWRRRVMIQTPDPFPTGFQIVSEDATTCRTWSDSGRESSDGAGSAVSNICVAGLGLEKASDTSNLEVMEV